MRIAFRSLPVVFALLAALPGRSADACEGTVQPACSRTIWVACATDSSIVHPGAGNDIVVPIRIFPNIAWNTNPACAQPGGAPVLTVALECDPVGPGDVIEIAASQVPTATPTVPGIQPLLTGPGSTPEIGGPYEVTIPADALAPGVDYVCTVSVTCQQTFGFGVGQGTILAQKTGEVCIVRPSSVSSTTPALELRRLLTAGEDGLIRCRRGDEALMHYLLANNEPDLGVTLTLEAYSSQLARLPVSAPGDALVYSVSSNKKKTDNFPLRFADLTDLAVLVPQGNPMKKDDQRIKRSYFLAPGEVRLVSITGRSHGMCSDGSCCVIPVSVSGGCDDGGSAIACAGAVLMVDDVAAKTPLFEITDEVKVGATTDALWSKTTFDQDSHLTTLHEGNLTKKQGGPGTQTTGASLSPELPYPDQASDYLRLDFVPQQASFSFTAFPQEDNFQKTKMKVKVSNLSASTGSIAIPLIKRSGVKGNFSLAVDAEAGTATLKDKAKKNKKLFSGLLSELIGDPPEGLVVDTGTCRTITISGQSGSYLCGRPQRHARVFDAAGSPEDLVVEVLDPLFDQRLAWTATSDNLAVSVPASGTDTDDLVASFSVADTEAFPGTSVSWISLDSVGAFNAPYRMPIVSRKITGLTTPMPLDISDFSGSVRLVTQKEKDKVKVRGSIDLAPDFKPKGHRVTLRLLDVDYPFVLDKKGKGKGGPKGASFALDKKTGEWNLKLKKQDLSGIFSEIGVDQFQTLKVPVLAELPVLGRFFQSELSYRSEVELLVVLDAKLIAGFDLAE